MTNYEKLTRAMPKQLAEILVKIMRCPDGIQDEYCQKCPAKIWNTCEVMGDCTIPIEDIVLWWLNQLAR